MLVTVIMIQRVSHRERYIDGNGSVLLILVVLPS